MPTAQKIFELRTVSASLTSATGTTAYTDGDAISAVTTNALFTFTSTVRERSGTIIGAILHSSQNNTTLKLAAELWLFRTPIGLVADNAAFAPTDAEMKTCVGVIDFAAASWRAGSATSGAAGNALVQANQGDMPFTDDGESQTLYGQLVAKNAYAKVDSEIYTIDLIIQQD